jgi:hypothetical protein
VLLRQAAIGRSGRLPGTQAFVEGGFEINVPAERQRISERQNLCRPETVEAVLAFLAVDLELTGFDKTLSRDATYA